MITSLAVFLCPTHYLSQGSSSASVSSLCSFPEHNHCGEGQLQDLMNLMHDLSAYSDQFLNMVCVKLQEYRTPALQPTGKASVELSKVSLELDHWGIG